MTKAARYWAGFKRSMAKVFFCWIMQAHSWTSAAQEGTPPTPEQLTNGIVGFWDYARMYCRRCGHEARPSVAARARAAKEAANG